jgi:hypothetical protein
MNRVSLSVTIAITVLIAVPELYALWSVLCE